MPERLCRRCGCGNQPNIELIDGVLLYTFPRRCKECEPKRKAHRWGPRLSRRFAPGGPYRRDRYAGRLEVYGGMCAFCLHARGTTFDHAIPVSRGGSNHPSNIYPACRPCNKEKGDRILHLEWVPPALRNNPPSDNKISHGF